MITKTLVTLLLGLQTPPAPTPVPAPAAHDIQRVLEAFVADYRNDPMAIDSEFGIKVRDEWWTVTVKRKQRAYSPPPPNQRLTYHEFGPHEVTLRRGAPSTPTWYFDIAGPDVLNAVAAGQINAGTAGMRSFSSERVGFMTEAMPGFTMSAGAIADMYVAESHFWTTGIPEVTYFGRDRSLPTHGAMATSLHAMKDKRIGWFSLGPDAAANEDPRLEFGQVPNLIIVTRGRARAVIGDKEMELREGMSVFVPPYVKHVISNPYDEPMEGILVLFGDNAEFAFGTSYPDFIQDFNAFLGAYLFRKD